ncbi:protein inturned isoform X2 [Lethenteron reissneri]|uniref:protein inturned isoform X2 n=1 Tax=Lethenteron reissneri TaxID=7753 RepID=UPI002AB65DF7|nr:protein inturned isoform X2 [Lethenteron reissneri]
MERIRKKTTEKMFTQSCEADALEEMHSLHYPGSAALRLASAGPLCWDPECSGSCGYGEPLLESREVGLFGGQPGALHWPRRTLDALDSVGSVLAHSELEPEWLDEVQPNGELFYLELSEGEETAALAQEEEEAGIAAPSSGGAPGQDAARRKDGGRPKLRKLADILRRRKTARRELPADGANGDRKGHSGDTVFTKGPGDGGDGGDDAPPLVVARLRFRDVTLYVNPLRRPTGERDIRVGEEAPLLGSLLGILHRASGRQGRDARSGRKSRSEDSVAPIADEKISVHGLVHGGAAMESGKIYIGDSLVAVNDVDVTTENIERVLSCIPGPMKVRLTMEVEGGASAGRGRAEGDEESSAVYSHSGLVRLLSGEDTADLHARLSSHPHSAMYLSLRLDSESACEEEDIIYSFPRRGPAARLRAVRGIFLTLSDMLPRVTGDSVRSSSMVIEGRLVHVAYWREGDGLLLLGLPADRVPLARLRNLISDLARLLSFLHGSLHKAFNQRTEGPGHLDQLFSLLFQHCLEPESLCTHSGPGAPAAPSPVGLHPHCSGAEFLDNLPAAPWLPLPQDIKVDIDTTLSELESADFQELSEDYYSMRRLYTILGSCLFYKGCLVANHLPREELTAVTLYCRLHGLLLLTRSPRAGQLVVWRELFPRKPRTAVATGYSPPEGARHFLLIVGLGPCLLSVVLEAGGCSASAVGSPGPDPGYVEEARATLLALDSLSVPARIREHLERPPLPELSCADCFLGHSTGGGSTVFSPGHRRTQSSPGFRGPRRLSPSPARGRQDGADSPAPGTTAQRSAEGGVPGMPGRRESQGSGVSAGSGGSSGVTSAFKITKKRSSPFLLGGGWRESADADTQEMSSVCRLTSGAENTLFHYVSLEVAEGVYIAPAHSDVERLGGTLHAQLLASFHRCCLSIRALFQQSSPLARTDQPDVLQGSDLRGERSPLGRVREHGVLFHCSAPFWNDPKKPAPTLTYWVLGRQCLEPPAREFYVCFHDSVSESAVELAFKLAFGVAM